MATDSREHLDRNREGYYDPTAGAALRNIEREERRSTVCQKPPVGVPPYYIAAQSRIEALAGAIQRYSHERNGHRKIEGWALEIVEQCILISHLNGEEAKR